MASGTLTIKLRPLKFCFLVDPSDKKGLLEAIEINTLLWGGTFNSLIPSFQRLPMHWEAHRKKIDTARTIVSGYLDAFDPDYVVPIGKCIGRNYDIGHRDIVKPSELLKKIEKDWVPTYGIGLFEVLKYFINEELKFVRQEPFDIIFLTFPTKYRLFLASVFGSLPNSSQSIIDSHFASPLQSRKIACSIFDYIDLLNPKTLFPRRMSEIYIKQRLLRSIIFFMNANNALDIMDYWNLRAAGYSIIPIPVQSCSNKSIKSACVEFIEKNYYPLRYNFSMYHKTTVIKSRSISEHQVTQFIDSLEIKQSKYGEPKLSSQRWYPRMWDEWARKNAMEQVENIYSAETDVSLSGHQTTIDFRTLDPKFSNCFGHSGNPRFANEINIRFYGAKEPIAEVIPEGGKQLTSAIGMIGYGEWRFSKSGPVYLSRHQDWFVDLQIPKAEDVVMAWFKENGWNVKISDKGKIAKQMLIQLKGIYGINCLAHEGIIQLLKDLSSDKFMSVEEVRGRLDKIIRQDNLFGGAEKFLEWLLEIQMLRLGASVQCPTCTQRSWYSVKELDYKLGCRKCLAEYSLPSQSPSEIKWSYKAFGPFCLPRRAYGAYTVLLTLKFLSKYHDAAITPIMSFTANNGNKEIEADLGLFCEYMLFGSNRNELIFVECKTYNEFQKKDIDRLGILAKEFPGAILVLATLRAKFSKKVVPEKLQ